MIGRETIGDIESYLDLILSLANEIKTYTQAAEADTASINGRVASEEVVFFLGFGYHPQNLEWLQRIMVNSTTNIKIVTGTTYGLGSEQAKSVAINLRKVFPLTSIAYMDERYTGHKIRQFFSNVYDIM